MEDYLDLGLMNLITKFQLGIRICHLFLAQISVPSLHVMISQRQSISNLLCLAIIFR